MGNCKKTQFTPDVHFTLLLIDDAKFVFVETDHVDKTHESRGIERMLNVNFREWVQPKEKKIISVMDYKTDEFIDAVDVAIDWGGLRYTLALVQ